MLGNCARKFGIEVCAINAGYNRSEATKKAKRAHYKPVTSILHFNLITTLHSAINSLKGNFELSYVCKHQNNQNKESMLKEKLNAIANTRVKVALWEYVVLE